MRDCPGCALSERVQLRGEGFAGVQPAHQTMHCRWLRPPRGTHFFLICPRVPWSWGNPAHRALGLKLRGFLMFLGRAVLVGEVRTG